MPKPKKVIPLPKLLQKAQRVFNCFIRKRDNDRGCISCNGRVDHAGHYFSAGHYTALRFSELNTNGQCVACNRYRSGNLILYRKGLVKKYGEEKVLMLENSADLRKKKKWSRIELDWLIEQYKTK